MLRLYGSFSNKKVKGVIQGITGNGNDHNAKPEPSCVFLVPQTTAV